MSVLLQVDFSENFRIVHQDEVQSAHWSHEQVTLYTACAWTKISGKKVVLTYVVVSDYMSHDKYAVYTFNKLLIEDIQKKVPMVEHIDVFSDGAGQHFKQRYTLAVMSTNEVSTDWHFFSTSHGKGAVDGIGGTIKRMVHDGIKARQILPYDTKSFADCAADISQKIKIIFSSKLDVEKEIQQANNLWEGVKGIPDLRVHSIRTVSPYVVQYSTVSDEDGPVLQLRSTGIRPAVTVALIQPQGGSSQSQVVEQEVTVHSVPTDIECWYAVNWKENNYWFLDRAISVNGHNVTFAFLQQSNPGVNQFEDVTDVDETDCSNIFYKLKEAPRPISSSRSHIMRINDEDFQQIQMKFK